MTILRVDPVSPEPEPIERAAAVIRRGGLVAFPTETVYGLGANAEDPDAVQKIFTAKGRPATNPLIVHVADLEEARELADPWPETAERLAAAFWPGPLTLVVPRWHGVIDPVTAGLPSVALRMASHPVALALVRAAGVPIAAPSANRSSMVSPTTAMHVHKSLGDAVDLILDGGPTRVGIESTVVDLTGDVPRLLRPGVIARAALEGIVGPMETGPAVVPADTPRAAPGMMARHYAPRAELRLFGANQRAAASELARSSTGAGGRVGALLLTPLDVPIHHPLYMPAESGAYAQRLYAALHELDDLGCDLILVEEVPAGAPWDAVRDRLQHAAT